MFVCAAGVAATGQAPPDVVRRGYDLLYQGDRAAAGRHFEASLAAKPSDLPLQFGHLLVINERLDDDPSVAGDFERRLDGFIAAADKRHDANGRDTEAMFYLAQAHLLRASYRFDHDKGLLGAARDGARAKNLSEAYIKVRPDDADALLALGLYNYFADLAPTFAKIFRFMLFLPSGDRVKGLQQIERAASHGSIFAEKAQRLVVEIYSRLEGRPAEALAIAERLHRTRPASDDVAFLLAGVYAGPGIENRPRAAAVYEEIVARRRQDESADGAAARTRATQALASVQVDQWRLDAAIATLAAVIDARPARPDFALPEALLRRGNFRALVNDAGAAGDARRVLEAPAHAKWHAPARSLLSWIERRAGTPEATVYAALIPANRLTAESKWDAAQREYDLVATRHPNDPQVRLRIAQLHIQSGQSERAVPTLSALGASGRIVPDWIKASALLGLGRAHDLAGRRAEATRAYETVVDRYENERAAAAARLGLITPYKRPGT